MISYAIKCVPGRHDFDGWFRSSDDFERQVTAGLVACPVCGSTEVAKALMKPAIAAGSRSRAAEQAAVATTRSPSGASIASTGPATSAAPAPPDAPTNGNPGGFANAEAAAKVMAQLHAITRELRAKADYVGPKFAEEARRIHYGDSEHRRIYGEATKEEVDSLGEEGITAVALPMLPEDHN